jgi:HPt (histidine-containing phosphotransfer) domain-containing protein
MFLVEVPAWMDKLEKAIAAGNAEEVNRVAHTIKGGVSTFAAKEAYDAAFQLETIGREKNLQAAPAAWRRLQEAIARLTAALAAFQPD